MKTFLFIALAFTLATACEKPMSEAERNAQIEREVQQRLEADRQAAEQQRLDQERAELEAREKALADEQAAAAAAGPAGSVATPRTTPRAVAIDATADASAQEEDGPRGYDTFYRRLEPHGAWRETADYGYVWQPREAQRSRSWRPYTDGRWAYTDAGWTWVSEEPFGWATYHYGRWTRLRGVGWVWVPGDQWAPAWVSWRKSDQHVGWAPLPPEAHFERRTGIKKWADSYYDIDAEEYVFIPNEEIGSNEIERAIIPVERNVTIVNQTTNVTNITYNNTIVVNEGPDYEELRGRSREPLRRLRLQRQTEWRGDAAPQPTIQDGVIAMVAPLFTARAAERPRTIGEPIRQRAGDRERSAEGNPEAEKARAKMKSEATPPPDAPPKTYQKPVVAERTPAPVASPSVARAQPSASPSISPAATSPTPTPRAAATATARPASTATPRATQAATATPTPATRPLATPTPTARPVATATASPSPRASATPRVTATPSPAATPVSSPTPRTTPAATAPRISPTPATTVAPRVVTTPAPLATATPPATPAATLTPTPRVAPPRLSPSPSPADAASPLNVGPGRRPATGQDRPLDPQRRPAAAESPAVASGAATAPAIPPRQIAPPAPPVNTPPVSQAIPASTPAVSARPAAASPAATPSPTASPTPGSRGKNAKRQPRDPKKDVDAAEEPEPSPGRNRP